MNWLTLLGTGDEGNNGRDEEGKLYLHIISQSHEPPRTHVRLPYMPCFLFYKGSEVFLSRELSCDVGRGVHTSSGAAF